MQVTGVDSNYNHYSNEQKVPPQEKTFGDILKSTIYINNKTPSHVTWSRSEKVDTAEEIRRRVLTIWMQFMMTGMISASDLQFLKQHAQALYKKVLEMQQEESARVTDHNETEATSQDINPYAFTSKLPETAFLSTSAGIA